MLMSHTHLLRSKSSRPLRIVDKWETKDVDHICKGGASEPEIA